MARGFIAVLLLGLFGVTIYVFVLSNQLSTANSALGKVRGQMENLQRQITDLDEPILRDGPKKADVVDAMTEEQRAAYVLSLLQQEDARDAAKAGDRAAQTERNAKLATELVETQDALENMKLLYGDVHSRIDALLKERQVLMRENQLLRNEIRRLQNRLPQYQHTGEAAD